MDFCQQVAKGRSQQEGKEAWQL